MGVRFVVGVFIYLVIGIIMGTIANVIIDSKGYNESYWFFLGLFFGGIAVIAAACRPYAFESNLEKRLESIQKSLDQIVAMMNSNAQRQVKQEIKGQVRQDEKNTF